ncbi:galactose metabolism-related protein [Rhodotorula kratochvilovae]
MGNNPSTPQAPPGSSSRSSRSSPRSRTVSLPSTSASSDARPHSSRRRKPSIELPDVAPAPAHPHPPPRRKGSDRPPVVDEEPDPDPPEGPGGSLRGALQGKAEHVVYGPRREDDDAGAVLSSPPALLPTPTASASAPKPAAAMAIPGAGPRAPGLRTPGGGGPGLRDGSLTNAGMGAIGASPLMDPDDTTHPGFGASARLTSAVLMSTDRMPVLGSPGRESPPKDSPFAQRAKKEAAIREEEGAGRDDSPDTGREVRRVVPAPQASFAGAVSSILAPAPDAGAGATPTTLPTDAELPPPHTASPSPPSTQPADTVLAPVVPAHALPLASEAIPSGTSVLASPQASRGTTPTGAIPSPAVLLPPAVFNAPVAAIPIPLLSVPSQTIAQSLIAAAVDLGAGAQGVPTLIKWKNEDGQAPAQGGKPARGPGEVFVTGTFAKGWKTKIELRKTDPSDFSALISLPPGPHRLKFIVDNEWKASKHLPVATDADGNLINYLQVNPVNSKIPATVWAPPAGAQLQQPTASAAATGVPVPTAQPTTTAVPTSSAAAAPPSKAYVAGGVGFNGVYWPVGPDEEDPAAAASGGGGTGSGFSGAGAGGDDDDAQWTQEIPAELLAWGEWEAQRDEIEGAFYAQHPNGPGPDAPPPEFPPPPPSAGVQPPTLPAQLEKGPLNHAAYVTQGSGDDNSILPKPDHSVINHLAASPIKGGFLSVGVTTRYKRKFVTIVYYKALNR